MTGLLGIPPGGRGSGRARHGQAMRLHAEGRLTAAQLEAYRVASADDTRPPAEVLVDRGLPVPDDPAAAPEALIRALIEESDRYLAALPGPGVAEVRAGLARWRDGPVTPAAPRENPVVADHLAPALAALAPDHPALAATLAAAAPHLAWVTYDRYPLAEIGESFAQGHAFASLIGEEAAIPAQDFDLGVFLIAPHVLYRDHCHAAPELYAPLTGPHGWRFGSGLPLVTRAAHQPVWNPPFQPHLTKVGPLPFLCLFAWTRDVAEPARVLPADDWPELEALRLG
jgi:hypothetical protein